jgi:hypothetical protein
LLERIQRGLAATITTTITVDGVATNPSPDAATVEIVRDDGTVLVTGGTAASDTGTGRFSYTLSPTLTADLDLLTAYWTVTIGTYEQTFTTQVEIVGGYLFSIPEAKATKPLDQAAYTTDLIVAARTEAERQLEDACGVAFVPRYIRETVDGTGGYDLMLARRRLRTVRTGTVDGTALTVSELADLEYAGTGRLRSPNVWAYGSEISVAYEHGYDYPPAGAGRAALRLAKHFLIDSPVDDRALRMDMEGGSYVMATPGLRGARFGIPEVDAFVDSFPSWAVA